MGRNIGASIDASHKALSTVFEQKRGAKSHYDSSGVGMRIHVQKTDPKSFVQRLRLNGNYIDLGLGGYAATLLAQVLRIAADKVTLATTGIDPHAAKEKPIVTPSINTVFKEFPEIRLRELSDEKYKAQ